MGTVDRMARATGSIVLTATIDNAPAGEGNRGDAVFPNAVVDGLAHALQAMTGWSMSPVLPVVLTKRWQRFPLRRSGSKRSGNDQ